MPNQTIEVSKKELALIVILLSAIVLLAITILTRDTWLSLLQSSDESKSILFLPIMQSTNNPVASRAETIAVALQAIDYQDPEGWLARLRPLATEAAYNALKQNYVGVLWGSFEQDQTAISPDQITATDRGVEAEGGLWQVRRVDVHIDDPHSTMQGIDRIFHIQLLNENGTWKLQAILDEDQVALLKVIPTSSVPTLPTPALTIVQILTPEPGKELPAAIAEQFVIAFTSVDYRDRELWLARMKATSTLAGFSFLSQDVLPLLWPSVIEREITITMSEVIAEDRGLLEEGETPLGPYQIREVYVEASPIEPGSPGTDTYYLFMVREFDADPADIFGGWRFEMFITPEMILRN